MLNVFEPTINHTLIRFPGAERNWNHERLRSEPENLTSVNAFKGFWVCDTPK